MPPKNWNNTTGGAGGGGDDDWDQQLARLRRFYSQYDPARVPHAEITLRTWRGSYNVMWSKLTTKYGPEPPSGGGSSSGAPSGLNVSALAAATMAAQKLSPSRNRGPAHSPAPAAYAGRSNIDYRSRLLRFYAHYAPHRLPTVDKALEIFRGKEESLFESLRRKFGDEPAETYPIPPEYQNANALPREQDAWMGEPTASGILPSNLPSATNWNRAHGLGSGGASAGNPYGADSQGNNRFQDPNTDNRAFSSGYPMGDNRNANNNNNNSLSASRGLPQMDVDDGNTNNSRRNLWNAGASGGNNNNVNNFGNLKDDSGSNDTNQQQQESDDESIDWEAACRPCSECTESLTECLRSRAMEKFYLFFYPVCLVLGIIGAIVTALVVVGVDRGNTCFRKTKSTSELDTSELYGPGLYSWGINTKAVNFPTYLQKMTISKDVVCCGGQNIILGETFYYTVADKEGTGAVNKTELGQMVQEFGEELGSVISKMEVQAKEALSDSIAAWSLTMSLDEFLSSREAIADVAYNGLIAELRRNKIFIPIPRRYFNLGSITIPTTYADQKIQVFANNQTTITAAYKEQATAYRLTTTQRIQDINANTSLILATAQTSATRQKNIATSTNAALDLQNIAYAIANMSNVVNATSESAAIDLFRLNELLDIVSETDQTDFFVSIADRGTAFPVV